MVIKTSPYAGDEDTVLVMDLHVPCLNAKYLGKGFDSRDGSWARRMIEDVENEIVAVAALVSHRSHHVLATRKEGHVEHLIVHLEKHPSDDLWLMSAPVVVERNRPRDDLLGLVVGVLVGIVERWAQVHHRMMIHARQKAPPYGRLMCNQKEGFVHLGTVSLSD